MSVSCAEIWGSSLHCIECVREQEGLEMSIIYCIYYRKSISMGSSPTIRL